ncbi:MAG: terminase family protein [Thermoplasmata archaeon]
MVKRKVDNEYIIKLSELFVDEYRNPIILSKTQKEIFLDIVLKRHNRIGIITPTQYGKSLVTALAVLIRSIVLPEKWAIIGGTTSKAQIIMEYLIDHLFDNQIFYSQLIIEGKLEQLKRERRRDHLTFKRGGEVFILSAEYRNRKRIGEALIGHGAQNIVLDDSCLCDDDQYTFVKRMLGGRKNTFMVEMSNPLRRNHFYRTMTTDKMYKKIWIDWRVAVKEGRFTQEFIDEMRVLPFFRQLYECQFPDEFEIDDKGYMFLLDTQTIENCFVNDVEFTYKNMKLGVDIGKGGNYNVFVVREGNKAKIVAKDRNPDLMATTGLIIRIMNDYNIHPNNVFIDDVGVGGGVVARLKELKYNVIGVNFGTSATDNISKNVRAQAYWNLKKWLQEGGKISPIDDRLREQLRALKYKVDSTGKIVLQPKEEMVIYGISSPDEADALALTFVEKQPAKILTSIERNIESKLFDIQSMLIRGG